MFFQFFITCKKTNNANNATHYVKLGKKRPESSKRNLVPTLFLKSDNNSNHHHRVDIGEEIDISNLSTQDAVPLLFSEVFFKRCMEKLRAAQQKGFISKDVNITKMNAEDAALHILSGLTNMSSVKWSSPGGRNAKNFNGKMQAALCVDKDRGIEYGNQKH